MEKMKTENGKGRKEGERVADKVGCAQAFASSTAARKSFPLSAF
jgi:hypothetical protein